MIQLSALYKPGRNYPTPHGGHFQVHTDLLGEYFRSLPNLPQTELELQSQLHESTQTNMFPITVAYGTTSSCKMYVIYMWAVVLPLLIDTNSVRPAKQMRLQTMIEFSVKLGMQLHVFETMLVVLDSGHLGE